MPRYLVCSNSQMSIPGTESKLRSSRSYGEYTDFDTAMKRMKQVAENSFKLRGQTTEYFINELAPEGTYPIVFKSYYL